MSYKANFKPNDIISSAQLNENFLDLRDDLEVYEDLTTQVNGITTDFTASNPFQASTQSLIEVIRNGKKQRSTGLSPDYQIIGASTIRFVPATNIPQIGETVEVIYRKVVS